MCKNETKDKYKKYAVDLATWFPKKSILWAIALRETSRQRQS